MSTKDYLLDVISRFRVVLDAHIRQLVCFDQYAIQVEGWLKGEIVQFFDSEKLATTLDEFETEVKCGYGRKRVDCFLKLQGTPVWVELKHWQIGSQGDQRWIASDYFVSKSFGIYGDADKLSKIIDGDRYILILATKNPDCEEQGDWGKGVDRFNQKFNPSHIKSYTNPSNFPRFYFLGLLEVTANA